MNEYHSSLLFFLYFCSMIERLWIQNFALIEKSEVEFGKGLNIITGETGAGKSIFIGALSALMGKKTDAAAILRPRKKIYH